MSVPFASSTRSTCVRSVMASSLALSFQCHSTPLSVVEGRMESTSAGEAPSTASLSTCTAAFELTSPTSLWRRDRAGASAAAVASEAPHAWLAWLSRLLPGSSTAKS